MTDTRRPNLPAVTPSACGLPNDSLFNSSALDRLGDSTLPEFPASLKKSRTSSVKVAAQPDLCSTPVIGSGIVRGQTPFEDKNDDSLFNSSALSRYAQLTIVLPYQAYPNCCILLFCYQSIRILQERRWHKNTTNN